MKYAVPALESTSYSSSKGFKSWMRLSTSSSSVRWASSSGSGSAEAAKNAKQSSGTNCYEKSRQFRLLICCNILSGVENLQETSCRRLPLLSMSQLQLCFVFSNFTSFIGTEPYNFYYVYHRLLACYKILPLWSRLHNSNMCVKNRVPSNDFNVA